MENFGTSCMIPQIFGMWLIKINPTVLISYTTKRANYRKCSSYYQASIYFFEVNSGSTRKIWSELTKETPEQHQDVALLLTLNRISTNVDFEQVNARWKLHNENWCRIFCLLYFASYIMLCNALSLNSYLIRVLLLSTDTVFPLISAGPQISVAPLGNIEISAFL